MSAPLRAVEDDHVDRLQVEALRGVKLSSTNHPKSSRELLVSKCAFLLLMTCQILQAVCIWNAESGIALRVHMVQRVRWL